ncbi:MAG: methyltransferase domain-containing protein [Alphaproteobacteria bacterium]
MIKKEDFTMDISIDNTLTTDIAAPCAAQPETKATTAQFVGSIPEMYDEHLGPLLFEFSAADLSKRVGDALTGADKLLEVACGTGILTEHLWRTLGPKTEILATDLNDAMLDYARDRRGALAGVRYQQADALSLPFADNSFDAVVCGFGIMFFPDKPRAFAEFARVLKPGGVLAFNVWGSLEDNRVADIARATIAGFFDNDPPDFLTVPFGFHETGPIHELIRGAGLAVEQTATVSVTIERPDAVSVSRGFVEGNPGILQIRERADVDAEEIVQKVADEIEQAFGPAPLRIRLREIAFLARKP